MGDKVFFSTLALQKYNQFAKAMNFPLYFNLGISHITDLGGYDHILFVVAICAAYRFRHWKQLALIVTAFTIGHSLSLALAVFELVSVWSDLIEWLIPLSILLTCLHNVTYPPQTDMNYATQIISTDYRRYLLVLGFGLIHGLGFSNFLRETLIADESIFMPLLAFNLGLEFGQLFIVFVFLLCSVLFLTVLARQHRDWNLFVSGAVFGIALLLFLERTPVVFGYAIE